MHADAVDFLRENNNRFTNDVINYESLIAKVAGFSMIKKYYYTEY